MAVGESGCLYSLLMMFKHQAWEVPRGSGKWLRHVRTTGSGQNSVFECIVDTVQFTALKLELSLLIDQEKDSLRFYRLGNNYKTKVEHVGAKPSIDIEDPLIF